MYHDFFSMRERPFRLVPDPAYLFLNKGHEEALAHLTYAVANGDGFAAITGEVGTGKTTLCRAFLGSLDDDTVAAYIFNPKLNGVQLLQAVNREFGIDSGASNCRELIDTLNTFLLDTRMDDRKVILVIDEAQNLNRDVLEQLRLLSNLETNTEKLLQIFLVGQPELATTLSSYQLRQLGQRITIRYQLEPFSYRDTGRYIQHRLKVASADQTLHFSKAAILAIHRFSGGIPRLINIVVDRALLMAFTKNSYSINWSTVREAVRELAIKNKSGLNNISRAFLRTAALVVAIILAGWAALFFLPSEKNKNEPARASVESSRQAPAGSVSVKKQVLSSPQPVIPEPGPALTDFSELTTIEELFSRRDALREVLEAWQQNHPEFTDQLETLTDPFFFLLACRNHNFFMLTVRNDLGKIDRLNLPAVLKMNFPDSIHPAYLSLIGIHGDEYFFRTNGREIVLSEDILRQGWSGEAYIPWKNFRAIEGVIPGNTKKDSILALKMLLQESGLTNLSMTPVYDRKTRDAVVDIQKQAGITVDGIVGPATKISIYNGLKSFHIPHLH